MTSTPYRKDPIFAGLLDNLTSCFSLAEEKKVRAFLVDIIPLDYWKNIGSPVAVTNSIVTVDVPHLDRIFRLKDSFYGIYYRPSSVDFLPPTKKFNCLMNRMDPIRQSWLYQLVRRGIFDQGYVSFNMDTLLMPEFKGVSPHDAFEKQFNDSMTIFQEEHDFIKSQVPYKNFNDDGDLTSVIVDSEFSIILETFFDQNDVITYSEKMFRALQLPRPWIVFSHQHAVKHLRTMGFDVLDDIVDHSLYDDIDFAITRQTKLLDLAVDLIKQNFDIDRLKQAAIHNQQLLKNFSVTWMDDYINCVTEAGKHI